MPPPRLGEALDQGLRLRIEIEKAHGPTIPARRGDRRRDTCDTFGLDVQDDAYAVLLCGLKMSEQPAELRYGQIGNTVVAAVLQRGDGHAFARSRDADDQQQVHESLRPSRRLP